MSFPHYKIFLLSKNSNYLFRYEAVKFQVAYNRKLTSFTDRDCDTTLDDSNTQSTLTSETTTPSTTVVSSMVSVNTIDQSGASSSTANPSTSGSTLNPGSRDARKRKWHADVSKVRGDYLLIPDGLYSERFFASKYCNQSLENVDEITGAFTSSLHIKNITILVLHPPNS